ncbi:MAG: stage sporulation protein [Clostridia bacterium]|jgi:stage IV sporulation protein FB|nr:peptidase [Clostridiales bacterium]MDK2984479.1 stage sporulation protein [Clostridia bacterium]
MAMRIAKIFNVPVKINDFFLILILAYTFLGVLPQVLILFSIVLVHEFAHCLAALKRGIGVKEMELFPFGGIAHLDFFEADSNHEFHVALAGPLVNFIMAGMGFILLNYWGINYWIIFFIRTNLVIGLFNLLPALPLDGGRLYRSIKAPKYGIQRATRAASRQGKIIATSLFMAGAIGLYYRFCDISVAILAIFLYISAGGQYKTASYHFIRFLSRKKEQFATRRIMEAENYIAKEDLSLEETISLLKPEKYGILLLVDEKGNITKKLSEEQIINAYFKYGPKLPLYKV